MRFTLLEMDGSTLFLIYVAGAVISWAIFYYTIKAAVKNGQIEAHEHLNRPAEVEKPSTFQKPTNPAQWTLQDRYDNGEITFEEYKEQWNKLS